MIALESDHKEGWLAEALDAYMANKSQLDTEPRLPVLPVSGLASDIAVHSNAFEQRLSHLEKFLLVIKESGLTLNLKKSCFAQKQVKFPGQGKGKLIQIKWL